MNLLAFRKRLDALETATGRADPRPTKAETRRTLHFLASDPEAGTLYTEALVLTSTLVTCDHKRHGWCRRCVEAVPTVGVAWQAYRARMTALESSHNQQGGEDIGPTQEQT